MSPKWGVIGCTLGKAEGRPEPNFFSLGPNSFAFNEYTSTISGMDRRSQLRKRLGFQVGFLS